MPKRRSSSLVLSGLIPSPSERCDWRVVSIWTDEELSILSEQWLWDGEGEFRDLTLAAATCPNPDCVHFPAFKHVIVGPGTIGPTAIKPMKGEDRHPKTTSVRCRCGEHDGDGCGRVGDVPVEPPS